MQSRFRRIQTLLTPLRVLEAAARLGSFTRAAAELGLSQPSVSRHIASLEQDLGAVLFVRTHNKLALTAEGQTLADAVGLGFSHILAAVHTIAASRERIGLTLACTHSFAHGWLLPRFSSLRRASRDRPINLVVSYWLKDIVLDEVDLIIDWRTAGSTDWPRLPLFEVVVYPVCAPTYLDPPFTLAALRTAKLLNYEVLEGDHVGWKSWFAEQGVFLNPPAAQDLFSNYHFMIQAAMDGEGVALGWHHLVADHIEQGRLIRVGPAFRPPNSFYSLEYREDLRSPASVAPVLEWFREQAAAMKAPA